MEFKKFMDMGIKTEEGVLLTKYLIAIHKAQENIAKDIKNQFVSHGYSLDVVPGEFLKIFTMNEKEVAELGVVLDEINELGLKEIFNYNLRPVSFKRGFLEKVKFCMANNLVYLNEDNSFIKELEDSEAFALYSSHKPMSSIKTAQEIEREEDRLSVLDPEDRQVYNSIVKNLNYLILQNPTNNYLPVIVDNILKKVIDDLSSKTYHFLPLRDVVDGVMFEGIDVTPEMESLREMVLEACPDELQDQKGRGIA